MTVKNAEKKCRKMPMDFVCEKCDFKTNKRSNFDKHIATDKHKYLHILTNTYTENAENVKTRITFSCKCGKNYTHRQSLYTHRRGCQIFNNNIGVNEMPKQDEPSDTSCEIRELKGMIVTVMKENTALVQKNSSLVQQTLELSNKLVDQGQMVNNGTIHNNNTSNNSHNKTFNLNFFLNETCKDAMNITDFVKSLQLNLQDLERVGELGYVEGISHAFVKGLNDLEVHKRPIHCSDLKREIIHIKDKDRWERDTTNQDKLKRAIKDVSNKNIMLLDDWQKKNPGYDKYNDRKNDIYLKMMVQAMGPADHIAEKRDFGKIIRRIAKNTIIEKE